MADIWTQALEELKTEQSTGGQSPVAEPVSQWDLLLNPLKRTVEEAGAGLKKMAAPTFERGIISKGLGKIGLPPLNPYVEAFLQQGEGALQFAGAPVTGLLQEPVSNIVSHYGEKAGVPELYAKTAGTTAGLLAGLLAPNSLTNWPGAIGRGISTLARKPLAKLAEKEALTNTVAQQQAQRFGRAEELGADVNLFEDAASGLVPQANTAARVAERLKGMSQANLANLRAAQQATTDLASQRAAAQLKGLPLRTEPTPTSIAETGKAYVGDRAAKEAGLFQEQSGALKKQLSEQINKIIPEGLQVEDITPLRETAKTLLPEVKLSDLSSKAESIASGILRRTAKLDPEARALALEQELEQTLSSSFKGKGVNLKDLIDPQDLIIGQSELPTARAVQHERSLLRAMERAANRSGHSSLARELNTLERGYTNTINDALGTEGASALKAWDTKYGYAVNELFGYKSAPYKLAQKKAEDVVTGLFRNTGELQETRVLKTLELLGPKNKPLVANGFMDAIFARSQTPGIEFNPVKWGQEYLAYKDGVRGALFSPEHKKTLDDIAKTLATGPVRHAQSVEQLKALAEQSKGRATFATKRSAALEESISGLEKEAALTRGEISSNLKKPTETEIAALERLGELEPQSRLAEFLAKEQPYAARRGMFGIGAMIFNPAFGSHIAIESGLTFIGAGALHRMLTNDTGAKIVRALIKSRPGSTEALRYSNAANLFLREREQSEQ